MLLSFLDDITVWLVRTVNMINTKRNRCFIQRGNYIFYLVAKTYLSFFFQKDLVLILWWFFPFPEKQHSFKHRYISYHLPSSGSLPSPDSLNLSSNYYSPIRSGTPQNLFPQWPLLENYWASFLCYSMLTFTSQQSFQYSHQVTASSTS